MSDHRLILLSGLAVLPALLLAACGEGAPSAAAEPALSSQAVTCAVWNASTAYLQGDTVTYGGGSYRANWWTQGDNPGTRSGPAGSGQPWTAVSSCGAVTPAPSPATPAAATGTVCFYADANFQGASFCAGSSSGWVGTDWNDRISSVKVPAGTQVQLFGDSNYGGASRTFSADASFVGADFNDLASSFKLASASVAAQRDDAGMDRLVGQFVVNTNGWTKGLTLDTIINAYERTHDTRYRTLIDGSFQYGKGWRSGDANKLYFDDMGWYANTWLRAYDVTGDRKFLTEAQAIFGDMTKAWDSTCGGGLWWNSDRQYKNAITNELFLLIAARLDRRASNGTGAGSYRDWALREWKWFSGSGMINAQHGVNDGLDSACRNNGGPTFTYNQGIILSGLVELWRVSGDRGYLFSAEQIAENTMSTQVYPGGILKEPGGAEDPCGQEGDGTIFKSAFAQGLARLYNADRGNKPQYLTFLKNNADSVRTKSRDASNTLGVNWSGPAGCPNKTSHASAMMVIGQVALLEAGGETSAVPK